MRRAILLLLVLGCDVEPKTGEFGPAPVGDTGPDSGSSSDGASSDSSESGDSSDSGTGYEFPEVAPIASRMECAQMAVEIAESCDDSWESVTCPASPSGFRDLWPEHTFCEDENVPGCSECYDALMSAVLNGAQSIMKGDPWDCTSFHGDNFFNPGCLSD